MSFDGNEGSIVTLKQASDWTAEFRKTISAGDTIAQFYGRDKIEQILAQEDCMGIRIYHGIDEDGKRILILVGADRNENDMTSGIIVEIGPKCPPICSTSNPLNS